jgi:hypothetical protein
MKQRSTYGLMLRSDNPNIHLRRTNSKSIMQPNDIIRSIHWTRAPNLCLSLQHRFLRQQPRAQWTLRHFVLVGDSDTPV